MRKTYKCADAGHRVCAICGKPNGSGFTTALRALGYDVPPGTMAYAHNTCLHRVQMSARRRPR